MSTPDYPTDEQLEKIKEWDAADFHGLLAFIRPLWAFDSWGLASRRRHIPHLNGWVVGQRGYY